MRRFTPVVLFVLAVLAFAAPAYAQGGGASSTGTITGKITDSSEAALPGVTVTLTGPTLIGTQTQVSNEQGIYRFPGVPPGTFTVKYELAGFSTLVREGIDVRLGFTATVNVQLAVASLQETVTVTGESPVVDTSATRVQQNFKLEQLQSIPNGRDMWALLAVTPAVMMGRIDVGGNRAGTQTGYTAYGFNGQVRVLIEGINTTEGTGAAGFYFDYASLEEAFLGTSGQSAEMPNPGVQSQFIAKSGGNRFSGEYYLDWYNNALQGSNLPSSYTDPTAFNSSPIRPHSNEIQRYYDTAINVGGPVKKDKLWWFFTYRDQKNAVAQPNFTFDKSFDTRLWNPVTKWTYQINQNNKLIGYYQWGQKTQPNRLVGCCGSYTYTDPGQTLEQNSGSWVYKAEWNSTLSDKLYLEARYGDFGYYFPLLGNSDEQYFWRDTGQAVLTGTERKWELDRDRKQWTGAATYFLDTGGAGSHSLRFGGELLLEKAWEGFLQRYGGNIEHIYANGRSSQVVFGFPTARDVGKLQNQENLLAESALDHLGFFVNDSWAIGRMTVNAGVRYDRYKGWLPEQVQMGGTNGPVTIADQTFAEDTLFTWNKVAPRVGTIFDLTRDGKTVIKVNYGLFWHNPGVSIPANANANQSSKTETYVWNDANGDRRFQLGEQGARLASALSGSVSVDPNLKAPYTHEAGVFFERELAASLGTRVGFVYKTEDDLIEQYVPGRGIDAYTVPYSFTDIGVDGRSGTSDDRVLTLFGVPSANAATLFPVNQVVMNLPRFSRYKTVEASLNKRYGNKWSASIGGSHSWRHDFPEGFPNTPNHPGVQDRTTWDFKLTGSYDAPWDIRISPVVRHQSGVNFARTISVPASVASAAGLIFSGTIYADSADSNREDNITVFDVRTEKTIRLNGNVRLRAFLDVFNITNSYASETIVRSTGLSYLKPSAILAPRTARVGFRFMW
ncbi:MAG: carboxypeptidase regulatory-like domain-containing protein [Gaiellales bacterium]